MANAKKDNHPLSLRKEEEGREQFPGYPPYSPGEDIYQQGEREEEADIDGNAKKPKDKEINNIGKGMDIPGAELDDADEELGEEDEENNYYSLGGENHEDLEENNE